ncbi:MAG: exosortase/archaeosortase family protein [Methylacidiphilales bacterium]|nr:exosortase/archaeosortase family protein [Candidatus Methylacidiphilales bacterium]
MNLNWRLFLTWPWMVSIVAVTLLFGFVPYYTGYDATLKSLAQGYPALFTTYQGDWAHCFFVPFIVGWMVYRDWKTIAAVPLRPSNWGIVPIIVGLAIYWFGQRANVHYFAYPALQLFYMGLVVWFAGWGMFKAVFFYWLFLCFMYPLPAFTDQIAVTLRHFMTWCSAGILNFIGIPVVRMGTGIFSAPDLANGLAQGELFQLEVADPCSGIRSLFALVMLSALYGYLAMRKTWQKLAIFALAVPFAIMGNIARILILTAGTLLLGPETAVGTLENPSLYHMAAGYAVFIVAIGMMMLTGWLFERPWAEYWQRLTQSPSPVFSAAGETSATISYPSIPDEQGEGTNPASSSNGNDVMDIHSKPSKSPSSE